MEWKISFNLVFLLSDMLGDCFIETKFSIAILTTIYSFRSAFESNIGTKTKLFPSRNSGIKRFIFHLIYNYSVKFTMDIK